VFQEEVGRLEATKREDIMKIVISWMEKGIEQGLQRERALILRQLTRQVGALPEPVKVQIDALAIARLEALGEALLDFSNLSESMF
jgi:predicted transposase YdaD